MVALANDWRLTEERAFHYLIPGRILTRYQEISGKPQPDVSINEMLLTVVRHDTMDDDLSDCNTE